MSESGSPNIPKGGLPRREELRASGGRTIHAGRSVKADLLRFDRDGCALVVKDFGGKTWWVRCLGRLQIARECRAYRRLEGVEGVPRYFGRIDAHAMAIEWVDGRPLGTRPEREIDGPARYRKLSAIVARIHERGVLHLDLRAMRNALVRADGRVFVVDFAGAVCLRPGGLAHRLLFRRLSITDVAALLKWKQVLAPGTLDEAERRIVARHRRWRRLWIFNRKGRARR